MKIALQNEKCAQTSFFIARKTCAKVSFVIPTAAPQGEGRNPFAI